MVDLPILEIIIELQAMSDNHSSLQIKVADIFLTSFFCVNDKFS